MARARRASRTLAAKRRLGSFGFQSQYQQAPIAREGNLIKLEWLSGTFREIPRRFDSIVMSVDTAFKTRDVSDFSAAVIIGTLNGPRDGFGPGHYLLDAWRGQVEFAALKRRVIELNATWRPHVVLIEDAASGQSLIQELRAGTILPIRPIRVDRDKLARVAAITPTLEARRLLLRESAWWRDELIAELISFPAGAHDDWVDALAQALLFANSDRAWFEHLEAVKQLNRGVRVSPPSELAAAARLTGAPDVLVRHFEGARPASTRDLSQSLFDAYFQLRPDSGAAGPPAPQRAGA